MWIWREGSDSQNRRQGEEKKKKGFWLINGYIATTTKLQTDAFIYAHACRNTYSAAISVRKMLFQNTEEKEKMNDCATKRIEFLVGYMMPVIVQYISFRHIWI